MTEVSRYRARTIPVPLLSSASLSSHAKLSRGQDLEDCSNTLTQDVIMLQKKVDEFPNKSCVKEYVQELARAQVSLQKKDDEISHLQSKVSFLKTDLGHAKKAFFKQDEKMSELKKVLTGYHQVIAQKDIEMASLVGASCGRLGQGDDNGNPSRAQNTCSFREHEER